MAKQLSTKVITDLVRLSYANVWEPKSINGGDPKYSCSIIVPKTDTETVNAINDAMEVHCATNGWVYLPWIDEMVKHSSWQTTYFTSISTNLHPNNAGHLLIGEVAERAVRQLNDTVVWGMRTIFDGTMPALEFQDTAPAKLQSVKVE